MNNESEEQSEEELEESIEERKIYTTPGDPEVESLLGKYKRGKLILQSDFQRHFVWDTKKSSRLIESALLGIPLPVIYLSEEKDSREVVIDGQQRLTSFFSFMDGNFPSGHPFRLNGLSVFHELNKKSYKELSEEYQDKIRYCKIRTITFNKDSSHDLKFKIFERLNSGAVSLNQQELRNCIFRGPYNELIKKLAQNEDFVSIVGQEPPRDRMRNIELVLRFAAFYHATYLQYTPPMLRFLNKEMEQYQSCDNEKAQEISSAFKNTVYIIKSLFGDHAFKRFYAGTNKNPDGYWEPQRFNASLYDIMMYSFAKEDKNKVYQNLDSIREALICLMTDDQEFIDSIELGTSGLQAVTKRFDKWRITLQNIIGIGQKEPRCFTFSIKEQLFKSNPTCSICNQRIQDVDDSAVDHIEQYWLGGKTIPENARLTHRYCNSARSRYDTSTRKLGFIPSIKKGKLSTTSSVNVNNGYAGRKPRSFILCGERYSATKWTELLFSLCSVLYDKYPAEFPILLELRGSKRQYVSTSASGMLAPVRIADSNYYVETNWSAPDTVKLCNRILDKIGIDESEFVVEYN
jgi:hypothetical protein